MPRTWRKPECEHPNGFIDDQRHPYRYSIVNGTKTETWRVVCPLCGAWLIAERIDGEMV